MDFRLLLLSISYSLLPTLEDNKRGQRYSRLTYIYIIYLYTCTHIHIYIYVYLYRYPYLHFHRYKDTRKLRKCALLPHTGAYACAGGLSERGCFGEAYLHELQAGRTQLGAQRPHKRKDLTFRFQGPIQGAYQTAWFVGSLCYVVFWAPTSPIPHLEFQGPIIMGCFSMNYGLL